MRIKDALEPLGRKLGLRSPAEAARVFSRWNEIVGATVVEHARPSSLKGGVLRIVAESSVWATEISYLAEEIKSRANEVAGAPVVSEVRVWTGKSSTTPESHPIGDTESDRRDPRIRDRELTSSKPPPDDPEEALARARNAWSEARFRTRRSASENPESRR
jgi:hypothetical protein